MGVKFVYKRAPLPDTQVVHDISYDLRTMSLKQRLDLYLPSGRDWPVVVFVHGGSWTSGDRTLSVSSADVYANIEHDSSPVIGYGTAVMSYRLLPTVDWRRAANNVPCKPWRRRARPSAIYGGPGATRSS